MGRKLGQHFLTDPRVLDRIAESIDPNPEDTVLEIGTGRGTLTRRLAKRVSRVISIERDPILIKGLKRSHLNQNITIVEGDALKLDWEELWPPESSRATRKVTGNIPYYITTPLIDKALSPPPPAVVAFLVQEEVAARICAQPGGKTYGALSVGVQIAAVVEHLFRVKAGAFQPPPKVDSAMIRMKPRVIPEGLDIRRFREFVTAVFSKRRKQILGILSEMKGRDRDQVTELLNDLGFRPEDRPETIPPEGFVRLFRECSR
ncbi:MAG: ribosomal RNA small subunit methyltransferase A [Gemmatimonadetes bacterium]|nr:ribosomal RNA small subunit methyltransferase A [Gemmatimonadota bacterium]